VGHTKFRWLGWLFSGVFTALVFASACAGGDEADTSPGGGGKKDGGGTGASGGTGGGTGGSSGDGGGTGGTDGGPCVPAEEVCDGEDNDCDGEIDEGSTNIKTWYEDKDGDNYGVSTGESKVACTQPVGFAEEVGDCNDNDPAFHPGALETNCDDPNDYNCDGSVGFVDADGDTFPACKECDDTDQDVYPGATEVCDGKDDDCDGSADFPGGEMDTDGDGVIACAECDDTDPLNYPGNTEKCDGQDNNCNGLADFAGGEIDADGDGSYSCLDCDDNDNDNYPGNAEICDGQDNNCNNLADFPGGEGNADGDPAPSCIDCNDNNPNIYPGKAEVCDGADNDCNPTTFASGGENDNDGDTSLACADCNDNDPTNFPNNPEKCDGKDNNCNGDIDQSEVPANILCPNAPNSTSSSCNGAQGCGIGACSTNYFDVNGTYTDGCECLAAPTPVTTGQACGSSINLGTLADVSGAFVNQSGNIPVAGREIWYTFNGSDDADTNGDEYHVDVRFTTNPGNNYRMDVYRNSCPGGGGGTQLASAESNTTDWYTDFNQTNSPPGPCPGPLPCGEGNCAPTGPTGPPDLKNICNNNSAQYYVRIYSIGAPSCAQFTVQFSNGFY
jgi:hypothetical protein